ncbi:MAG: VOC family protein [Proteobacteria bacterium]|nr:VOC family protein [Pseudomonadota bacterium]
MHFNTNVSDFERSRDFYGKLGFETVSGFPDTNTLAMAHAIGIETPTEYDGSAGDAAGGYLLHGELIGLGFTGGVIDLIEFTIPRSLEAPYAQLNHLGMARAAMLTTDIDADYQYMTGIGVEFLSEPVQRKNGSRFAIFKDPDGTFYELLAIEGEVEDTQTTHIKRLGAVSINVSDFERSAAWYGLFGYELKSSLDSRESLEVARAMGMSEPFEITGGLFVHKKDGSLIEIVEWISPRDDAPPYPAPINHLGIHRMAFSTSDIEADVEKLKAQGVSLVSDVTPCCSGPDSWGGIVAFYDPDGTIMELVEQPLMTFMAWVMRLFD